ncbi:uncharacterized protein LOC112345364 [Selaginella moellendorffii]|uniref:uncharacterized protein LOC112344211 n=1 Tax=Selaginella moellendorffii TaxID=88036 RepID=UPI000D1C56B5|nr:uncharacterized protein LOC112344211 [Selaginella moellendorffii]XP_024527680.1 uncharacterized protein LOC112345364 [Selaginella moellendorffii]|eukprot:XP_024524295.1 uncharacterized protein LOC112344211 [Selaginella moellendorffii]
MASSKNMDALNARKQLPNVWQAPLMSTPARDPLFCFYSIFCPFCAAYQLRGRSLHNDWSRYQCCGGGLPCSGRCGEPKCPRFCAATEAVLCFPMSVTATRFMIQDSLGIQNTKCDNCIIATMWFLQYLNCICWLVATFTNVPFIDDAALVVDRVADIAYCSVCACMQTQHKVELDVRDGLKPAVSRTPPAMQEMSRK